MLGPPVAPQKPRRGPGQAEELAPVVLAKGNFEAPAARPWPWPAEAPAHRCVLRQPAPPRRGSCQRRRWRRDSGSRSCQRRRWRKDTIRRLARAETSRRGPCQRRRWRRTRSQPTHRGPRRGSCQRRRWRLWPNYSARPDPEAPAGGGAGICPSTTWWTRLIESPARGSCRWRHWRTCAAPCSWSGSARRSRGEAPAGGDAGASASLSAP